MKRIAGAMSTSSGDVLAFVFALVAASASFAGDDPTAYAFPRLVSTLMLIFCGVNLIRRSLAGFAGEPALTMRLAGKIAPGVAVIVVYVLFAQDAGFYLSAIPGVLRVVLPVQRPPAPVVHRHRDRLRRRCPVSDVLRGAEGAGAEGVLPVTVFHPTERRGIS